MMSPREGPREKQIIWRINLENFILGSGIILIGVSETPMDSNNNNGRILILKSSEFNIVNLSIYLDLELNNLIRDEDVC